MNKVRFFIFYLIFQIFIFNAGIAFADELNGDFSINFNKIQVSDKDKAIPEKVIKKFAVYKVNFENTGTNEYTLNPQDLKYICDDNKIISPLTAKEVYKKSKVNVLGRTILFGAPIGVITLGFLAIPATATAFALSTDANNTLKKNLDELCIKDITVKPGQEFEFYIFIPKNSDKLKSITLKQL